MLTAQRLKLGGASPYKQKEDWYGEDESDGCCTGCQAKSSLADLD